MHPKFLLRVLLTPALLLPVLALACGSPPSKKNDISDPDNPGQTIPEVWTIDHGVNQTTGNHEMWFGVRIDLYPATNGELCSCGIGFSPSSALPASLAVTDVMFTRTDTQTDETISVFDQFDPMVPVPSGHPLLTELEGLGESGRIWFGLEGNIVGDVVVPLVPPLGPNEITKMWFMLETDPADAEMLSAVTEGMVLQFGAGSRANPDHQVAVFRARVPAPGALPLVALGLLVVAARRSRLAGSA